MFIIFLFVVYFIFSIAGAYDKWRAEALAGKPESDSSGVSILPGIPLFPILAWIFTWLSNKYISEHSFTISFYLHLLLLLVSIFLIIRSMDVLKNISK